MAEYKAPLKDIRFVMNEVFGVEQLWASLAGTKDTIDIDTADAVLEEAGKITASLIAPLSRNGDEEGCKWTDGVVTTPAGYKEAYKTFVEGGWSGLTGNPEYEGMGMPKMVGAQYEEMLYSSDISFGLYVCLTSGASLAIDAHATEELKQKYLPKMYSGEWAGAMDLTEPHAGTDLGMIRTKAEDNGDGSYAITGTKIFITGGDQDLSENVIHLVLAKLPDAPAGPKGISLFLVPRNKVDENNVVGENNNVTVGSIEHKMGIKASATCVMNFDGAQGWLVGEINQGLNAMFTMMNYERLSVGIQGLGAAERSYQNAVEYALDRIQGRAATGPAQPEKAADPLIVHPDIRRMLMTMRAYNEGGRAFSSYVATFLDTAKYSDDADEKKHASAMVALMTPIAKAYLTDRALDCCIAGQQVFGGHGFIREWGQEQLVRDTRITQIYEGTNGIQSLDLMGRKIVANGGKFYELFASEVASFIQVEADNADLAEFVKPLSAALERLSDVTEYVINSVKDDPNAIGAASVEYLELFGLTAYAYMWAKMVKAAAPKVGSDEFYASKVKTAKFFYSRLLPKTVSLAELVRSGSEDMMALAADQF
ncbi:MULTISPECIES: acyl-CoA dehydrogenase C-terminal domain-containing protein [unclassified Oleiphilus]|jgi:alkylation response protein AidB-like acyl-CoA dehydrogenase|nr:MULTISPECIES: acyl-CoA dehydrogenase C-terminal domain-containing protein [unclassified Oleiphilus]KZY42807.1 acyl-CoA dehydrogenase [Oleiphilus sp. HI0050]KZY76619.1 acyl-CoA dehydrogenase [Oleiphilus sp. HI0068]KZY83836.1 acyl-CoA dehydrogenase [Oleiphilus sp. HI0069]KZY87870.1 acyl-CoA dehydrogenase [Oleiphilus sp. HI0072]KZZ14534.1 acyl-CoA dehydrogenase [Oleiphilus sp. HI0078]